MSAKNNQIAEVLRFLIYHTYCDRDSIRHYCRVETFNLRLRDEFLTRGISGLILEIQLMSENMASITTIIGSTELSPIECYSAPKQESELV